MIEESLSALSLVHGGLQETAGLSKGPATGEADAGELSARSKMNRRLADQLERAIESIGDVIAENRGRATDKDFANFVTMAIGSSNEAEHHLDRARDGHALTEAEHRALTDDVIEVRKMLIGLRRRLRSCEPTSR